MGLLLLVTGLSILAGAIALIILVGKVIARMVNGPTPVDPTVPVLRRSYSSVINAILVILVILGAGSVAIWYAIGSALSRL